MTTITSLTIDAQTIRSWDDFHDLFSKQLGFPAFYGRNMNAWIDCMSYLDDPAAEMSTVHIDCGTVLTIKLKAHEALRNHCPDIWNALVDCSAFVNWRELEGGRNALIALAYYD